MNIKDFKVGDVIYIRRNVNGYSVDLKCGFCGVNKGLINAIILEVDPEYYKFNFPIHSKISARKKMCYIRYKRIFIDGTSIPDGCWWLNSKTGDFK